MPEPDDMPEPTETGGDRLVGRVVADRYRIENVVSSGANTVIVEAIDVTHDVPVTLKIVRPERALHAAFRDDFRRQVEIAMSLSHPNIAKVLDWGEVELYGETTVFWVVEYLGGGSLRDLFDRGRLLEPSQALVVGLEACRALDAAHSSGVIHTELTPSKLVFGDDARLRIVDFAMAGLLGAESWEEPATLATHVARYASPEQALRLEVDDKTDVYALSLCLIEAITGKVPFAGDSTVSTLSGRVGKLMPVTADMGSLAAVLERAGRPEGEDRWTAAEFGSALVQAAETLPRPEPIPIMASSLFGASMLQRRADRDAETRDAEPEVTVDTPVDVEPPTDDSTDDTGDDSPMDAPTVEAAAPLIVLTDIADRSVDDTVVAAAPDGVAGSPDRAAAGRGGCRGGSCHHTADHPDGRDRSDDTRNDLRRRATCAPVGQVHRHRSARGGRHRRSGRGRVPAPAYQVLRGARPGRGRPGRCAQRGVGQRLGHRDEPRTQRRGARGRPCGANDPGRRRDARRGRDVRDLRQRRP